jgi:hypothetical protein
MPKANAGSVPNLEGEKIGEKLPIVSNIPPKTHPIRPSSFL